MADLTLRYLLFGEDKTASKAVKGVGDTAESTASRVSSAVSRLGSAIGGDMGELLGRAAEAMDGLAGRGDKLGKRMLAVGSIAMGAGLAMQQMAAGDVEAQNRLTAAIEATGNSVDDYADRVDGLVASQVRWGNTDGDVKNALTKLVDAYRDPTKALERMQLATDLAAAKQISLGEASTIVARAHGGSAKIFKEFGVVVEAGADGTKNYEAALDDLAAQLSGRASASADSFSGKIREMKAWADNAASAFAESYGPAVTAFGATASGLGAILEIVRSRHAATAVAATGNAASTTASATATTAHSVASRAAALAAGAFNLAVAATPVGLILAAVAAIGAFAQAQANAKQAGEEFAQTLDRETGTITKASREWIAAKLFKDVDPEDFRKISGAVKISAAEIVEAISQGGGAVQELRDRIAAADESGGWATKSLDNAIVALSRDTDRGREVFAAMGDAVGGTGRASQGAASDVSALREKTQKAAEAADELRLAQAKLRDGLLDTRRANRDYEAALDDLSASIKDNGKTLDVGTEKGRKNEAALDALRDAALKAAEAQLRQGDSVDKAAAVMEARRRSFVDQAATLLGSKAAAESLADRLGFTRARVEELSLAISKTPDGKAIAIVAETAEAMARISALRSALGSVAGQVSISAKYAGMDKAIGNNAAGTDFWRGGLTWVGERGPELVNLPRGSQVFPADTSRAMASSPGSPSLPSTMVIVDSEGSLIGRMRVEASSVLAGQARELGWS